MKKCCTTLQYKQLQSVRSKRNQLRRSKQKRWRKKRNRFFNGLSKKHRNYLHQSRDAARQPSRFARSKTLEERYPHHVHIRSPKVLSFRRHPEDVIIFMAQINEAFIQRKNVFIQMEHVTAVDHDAVVALIPALIRFKAVNLDLNGSFPQKRVVKRTLKNSGFLENIYQKFKASGEYSVSSTRYFQTYGYNEIKPDHTAHIIETVTPCIWGQSKLCKGVQSVFLELMHNTFVHATPQNSEQKHWWLSVRQDPENKIVGFSFVDYGVGIFKSLENKPVSNKWFGWLEKLTLIYKFQNKAELLRLILNGQFHATVTGQPFRGKGLPMLKFQLDKNSIAELHVISNNVYANVAQDEYRMLRNDFGGTYVYWEINQTVTNFPV